MKKHKKARSFEAKLELKEKNDHHSNLQLCFQSDTCPNMTHKTNEKEKISAKLKKNL